MDSSCITCSLQVLYINIWNESLFVDLSLVTSFVMPSPVIFSREHLVTELAWVGQLLVDPQMFS